MKGHAMIPKPRSFLVLITITCLPLWTVACRRTDAVSLATFSVEQISNPARPGSAEPNLAVGDDGRLYLSWIENMEDVGHALRYSVKDENWSPPHTIASGDNWFVNWADFPSMAGFRDGTLAAHWLQKSGKGSYAYNVMVAFSEAGDSAWSEGVVPHRDGTETEHGFVSMLPWDDSNLFAVWLDGRNFAKKADGQDGHDPPANEMTLRFAMINQKGQLSKEAVLDPRVCDCCPTSAVRTQSGALVVYRNRTEKEIRDIGILRYQDGHWSEPRILYEDNWEIAGCPVNGPAIAADGQRVVVAWFTWANEIARVKAVLSDDEGK
ncbi:MAG: exo-alpha-sialidase, partial [bacterium]